jgi:hypothetical protein
MTPELTKTEEYIYNTYLRNLRNNQPYQPRKNFENLNDKIRISLYKLKNFFDKFSYIDKNFFFESFRFVYPQDNFPSLDFFTTRKAIKCYTLYKKHKENSSPDNLLEEIKEGLRFIANFCIQNNIPVESYTKHKTLCMPSWTQHYRENKVNIYSILSIDHLNDYYTLSEEERAIWAPNLIENIESFKVRLHNCKSKQNIKKCVDHIRNFVNKTLTNTKT